MKALDPATQSVLANMTDVLDILEQAEPKPVSDFREQQLFQSLDIDNDQHVRRC